MFPLLDQSILNPIKSTTMMMRSFTSRVHAAFISIFASPSVVYVEQLVQFCWLFTDETKEKENTGRRNYINDVISMRLERVIPSILSMEDNSYLFYVRSSLGINWNNCTMLCDLPISQKLKFSSHWSGGHEYRSTLYVFTRNKENNTSHHKGHISATVYRDLRRFC